MKRYIAISLTYLLINNAYATTVWENLAPGLDYTQIPLSSQSQLHAFKIDLNHYTIDLVLAKNETRLTAAVSELAQDSHALLAVNGGFFSPEQQPLGLRVQNGEIRNPLKQISWWGVFYIQNNTPYITSLTNFHFNPSITTAIQAGPRLAINGTVPSLKDNLAERSALCITPDKKVIIMVTRYASISTESLANLIIKSEQHDGLNCIDALNLDGGSSSQLYAQINDFKLNISSFNWVTDAVVIKRK